MGLRTFLDSEGREWQAFDVVPRTVERRSYDRRSMGSTAPAGRDRRDGDRRVSVGRRPSLSGVTAGWLCFEPTGGTERRRLTPIPDDWRHCGEDVLERYRLAARAVPEAASLSELAARQD